MTERQLQPHMHSLKLKQALMYGAWWAQNLLFQVLPKAMLHLKQVQPSYTPRWGPNATLGNANCNVLFPQHSLEHTTLAQSHIILRKHSPSCRLREHCGMDTHMCLAQHTSDAHLGRLFCGLHRDVLPCRYPLPQVACSSLPTCPQ